MSVCLPMPSVGGANETLKGLKKQAEHVMYQDNFKRIKLRETCILCCKN
jgi:hypothetical protein